MFHLQIQHQALILCHVHLQGLKASNTQCVDHMAIFTHNYVNRKIKARNPRNHMRSIAKNKNQYPQKIFKTCDIEN